VKNLYTIVTLAFFSQYCLADTFDRLSSITETETIEIEGTLIVEYGGFHLCQLGSTIGDRYEECVDVIFGERTWPEIPDLKIECVRIRGEFRAYSSEYIGIGWLVSNFGLLKGVEVKPCPDS
jgi:hypothetical protein